MSYTVLSETLGQQAEAAAERSYVPYSSRKQAAVLLLEDGSLILGVRVENASFSLTIPATLNAFSTAAALGKTQIAAVAVSYEPTDADTAFMSRHPYGPFLRDTDRLFIRSGLDKMPAPGDVLDPTQLPMKDRSPDKFTVAARAISTRAYIPESRFPVGCLVEMDDGRLIIGVNVEHPDWSQIICAERNALGTVVSYGLGEVKNIFLSCPSDELASPCGACRQVLVELAPKGTVWMDRGDENVAHAGIEELLPGHFSGRALIRSSD